jgi:diguanylate cyclase (GGDEF)-like protein/PAS domain S-box-containing protein
VEARDNLLDGKGVGLRPSDEPHEARDELLRLVSEGHLLRTFLETTPDAVYFKDAQSRFIKISQALAVRLQLADPDDAIGYTDHDFYAADHAMQALEDEREIVRTGRPLVDIEERETWDDGSEAWVSTTKLPLRNERGEIIGTFGLSRDITTRKLAEREVAQNQERMAAVIATQRDVATAELDLEAIMALVVERTQDLTHADGAALLLLDRGYLGFRAASGVAESQVRVRLPIGATILGDWLNAGEPVTCTDTRADERFARSLDRTVVERLSARSLVAVPLRHDAETVGMLMVVSAEAGAFAARDMESLQLLGVVLSAAISHAAEFAAKREQVEALAQFRAMYDGAPIGILLVDPAGAIVELNPAVTAMLGYATDELEGQVALDVIHPEDQADLGERFAALMRGECEQERLEVRARHQDGTDVWANLSLSLVRDSDGDPSFAIEMLEDITARKHAEEELRRHAELSQHQALHDALTELPNRVLFGDRIQQALLTAEREGGRLAVMLMDLDRFKEINDTLGHAAGDEVLKVVAERLAHCVRASDTVARLGGDEFGLLLPNQTEPSEITHLLEKLTDAIAEPIELDGLPLGIECSIGVAFYPEHGRQAEDLVMRADVAMYSAKSTSRPYAFYERTAGEHVDTGRLTLVGELRRAIDERQLVLHYQPKASLADGSIRSVEALVRWLHPERGLMPPDDFVPQAQETGLMKPLTMYVLEEALNQVVEWRKAGLELAVSVNLGTRNLIDTGFPDDVAALLAQTGVDARRLELEITESTVLEDPFRTKVVLDRLHSMGIRLSIDDFGTGYSSLAYLRQLPVHEIKIDRSFVLGMHENEDDAVIVRSTVDLGRNLGLDVVAEGVETARHWDELQALGCELAQGYFLSRPVPPDELAAWALERAAVATR